MSFGFGVGDLVSLTQLAWQVYRSCKDAPESFKNISAEVLSLHVVLKETEETLSSCNLPRTKKSSLETITSGCQAVLHDLQSLVKRYESLGLERKRALDRFGLHFNDIAELRARLTSNTVLLTAFLSTSQAVIEKQLNLYLQGFKDGRHEPSIISTQTVESLSMDQKEAWRNIRKDLEAIGISIAAFDANKHFIMEWFKEAIAAGAFEEQTLEDNSADMLMKDDLDLSLAMEDSDDDSGWCSFGSELSNITYSPSQCSEESEASTCHSSQISQLVLNLASTDGDHSEPQNIGVNISLRTRPSTPMTSSGTVREENAHLSKQINMGTKHTSTVTFYGPEPNPATADKRRHKSTNQSLMFGKVVGLLFRGAVRQRKALFWATNKGLQALVKQLLEMGADVNSRDQDNWTPLHCAAESGHDAIVKLLLERGADANSKNTKNWVPLHRAARFGHDAIVKLLLENGADINSENDNKRTPLHYAAKYGHDATVKLLLERGADANSKNTKNWVPLHRAARFGHDAIVKLLLENGADVNSEIDSKWTPLHLAARFAHDATVKLLLENGADINSENDNKRMPLHYAAKYRHDAIVKLLLENGADVNSKNTTRRMPVQYFKAVTQGWG